MSEKAEVMPSLFSPFLPQKRRVSKLASTHAQGTCVNTPKSYSNATNPLDTENFYPQIKRSTDFDFDAKTIFESCGDYRKIFIEKY